MFCTQQLYIHVYEKIIKNMNGIWVESISVTQVPALNGPEASAWPDALARIEKEHLVVP